MCIELYQIEIDRFGVGKENTKIDNVEIRVLAQSVEEALGFAKKFIEGTDDVIRAVRYISYITTGVGNYKCVEINPTTPPID